MLVGKRHEQVTLELWYQTGEDEMKVGEHDILNEILDKIIEDITAEDRPDLYSVFEARVREALCELIRLNYGTVANLVEMLEDCK